MDHSQESLEDQKLRLEIRDLSRPWYVRPVYLQALFPLLIGLATVFFLWKSRIFDMETAAHKLEIATQNYVLAQKTAEISGLESKRRDLEEGNKTLVEERNRFIREIASVHSELETSRERLRAVRGLYKITVDQENSLQPSLEKDLQLWDEFARNQQSVISTVIDKNIREIERLEREDADEDMKRAQTDEQRNAISLDLRKKIEESNQTAQQQKINIANGVEAARKKNDEILRAYREVLQVHTGILRMLESEQERDFERAYQDILDANGISKETLDDTSAEIEKISPNIGRPKRSARPPK